MFSVPPAIQEPPTPLERCLLRHLAQGQTMTDAAAALHLTSVETQALLTDLLHRHGLSELRRLIARALVHRWI